jgi:hypothetical protein
MGKSFDLLFIHLNLFLFNSPMSARTINGHGEHWKSSGNKFIFYSFLKKKFLFIINQLYIVTFSVSVIMHLAFI